MTPPHLLSPRERLVWLLGFVAIAAAIVLSGFKSSDPDSTRYAEISSKLSEQPVAHWIAPEWWNPPLDLGISGLFQEHPAGLFLVPAALARTGIPGEQAAYVFGVAAGLACVLLMGMLVARVTSRDDGRAVLTLLQVMPIAFVFRIRDNHEYPMLACLLLTLIGLDGLSRSWRAAGQVALGVAGGLLIKGVFVVLILLGAGLWILLNPSEGSRVRQIVACAAAIVCAAAVALAYDVWYVHATGGPFWIAYWTRQLAPMHVEAPLGQASAFARHVGFYVVRLLLHPAPWSVVLVWTGCRRWRIPASDRLAPRGLAFVLLFTAASVGLLSAASRFAERYTFSASYLIGAAGAVVAYRCWPRFRSWLTRLDAAVPALPAVVWIVLVGLRLALGPWLPRIGG